MFYLPARYLIGMAVWLVLSGVAFRGLLKLRRRSKDRPRRLRWVHLSLSLWMALAALTCVELWFAFVFDGTDSFNMTNVSKKWFRKHVEPQQHVLRFSDGQAVKYRDDRRFPRDKSPSARHILFVGDSFTFGHGVPDVADRFSNRVRNRLDREHPDRFVVSNLADAGTDLHWVHALLKTLFRDGYRIDTVVYVLCLNDVETFHPDRNKFYDEIASRNPSFFLFRETYSLNMLYVRARQFSRPKVRNYYDFLKDYYDGPPWRRMQSLLEQTAQLCRNHKCELRIVVFPFLHNLGDGYEFAPAHRRITAWCTEAHVRSLDLLPVLEPHAGETLTVSRFDAHPSERAHQIAAAAIYEKLLGDLLDVD